MQADDQRETWLAGRRQTTPDNPRDTTPRAADGVIREPLRRPYGILYQKVITGPKLGGSAPREAEP